MQVEQFYNPAAIIIALYTIVGLALLKLFLRGFVNYIVEHSQHWKDKGIELAEYYVRWVLFILLAFIIILDFLVFNVAGQIAGVAIFFLFGVSIDPFICQIFITCIAFLILYLALKRAFQTIKSQGIGIVEHPLLQPLRVDRTLGHLLEARRNRATPLSTDDQESLLAHIIDADSRGLLSLVNLSKKNKSNRR